MSNRAQQEYEDRVHYYKTLEESKYESEPEKGTDYGLYLEALSKEDNRVNTSYFYNKLNDDTYKILFSETFCYLFDKIRNHRYVMNESNVTMSKNLIRNYFGGMENINDFKRHIKTENTLILNDLLEVVEESHDKIMSKVDKKNSKTFKVDTGLLDEFYDKIVELPFDDASDTIKTRVSMAVQDFVVKNQEDKNKLEELVASTKDNIDSFKYTSESAIKAHAEAANLRFKREASEIRNRKKSFFEAMVYNLYESSIKNEDVKSVFISESTGKIDMDCILEYVEMRYTVMEMFNTLKIHKYSEEELRELLS